MGVKTVQVHPAGEDDVAKSSEFHPAPGRRIRPWHLFRYAEAVDWTMMAIAFVAAVCQGAAMPYFATIFGDSIDVSSGTQVAEGQTVLDLMKEPIYAMCVLSCVLLVAGTIWQAALNWTAERQCAILRKRYLKAVLHKDLEWFDLNTPAELPSRMAAEVQSVQDALGPKLGQIVMDSAQFIVGLVVAFLKGWEMSLVVCASLPFLVITGVYFGMYVGKLTGDKQECYGRAGAVAEESLLGIRTVSAFGGEEQEVERYAAELRPAKTAGIKSGFHIGLSFGSLIGTFGFCYGLAFWFGANHLVAPGVTSAHTGRPWSGSDVVLVFFAVLIGLSSLQDMAQPVMAWASALAAASKMFTTMETPSKIESEDNGAAPRFHEAREALAHKLGDSSINEISFQNVRFHYPSRPDIPILQGVSLKIERGQKVALVGESGSGKSTIIQLLERFYDPASGEVKVNGVPLRTLPLRAWRRQIGYVGQEPVLFAATVLKNIKGGESEVSDREAAAAAKQAQCDFLEALPEKYQTFVGVGGGQMSGGQKQRVAIARALVKRPQVLLLDEATSALDNESEKQVQATIDSLQAGSVAGLTTISVAHRLSTIRNSDIIFVMKAGEVAEEGSHETLMALEGEYRRMAQAQEAAQSTPIESLVSASLHADGQSNDVSVIDAGASNAEERKSTKGIIPDPTPAQEDGNAASKKTIGKEPSRRVLPKSDQELEEERLAALAKDKYQPPMGRLFEMSRPEWGVLPFAFVGAMASGAVMPLIGWILAKAQAAFYIPDIEEMKDKCNYWALMMVVVGCVAIVGETLKYSSFSYVQEHLTLRLRRQAFAALLRQEVGFFDDPANGPAGLTTSLERQTSQVSKITGISLGNVCGAACSLIVGLTLGFIASWRLSLFILGLVPVVGVAMTIVMVMTLGAGGSGEGNKAYSQAGEVAAESLLNIRTVRALSAEPQSCETFGETVDGVARKERGKAFKKGFAFGFGNATMNVIYIVAFAVGAWLIDDGYIDMEKMFSALFCIMFGVMGSGMVSAFAPDAAKGKLAARDVFLLIDRESKVDATAPKGLEMLGDRSIEFREVVFHYPHRPELAVLRGLNFTVRPDTAMSVAIVGPSGSGKSTIIQMLLRFYDPTSGSVLVGGNDLRDLNIAWWRRQVGFVGQEPILFDVSLEDNVRYGKPEASRAEIQQAAKQANMDYVISGKVKWTDNVGLKGGKLSGGQKQRCAIARALVRKPTILFFDEATSALDSNSEREVQKALDTVKEGRMSFTIAHRLSTIQNSDLILVVNQGTLAEKGTHDELMQQKGVYCNLVRRGNE